MLGNHNHERTLQRHDDWEKEQKHLFYRKDVDCPLDGDFYYSRCNVEHTCWIDDGVCQQLFFDLGAVNNYTPECNWDGGDCLFCLEESDFPY